VFIVATLKLCRKFRKIKLILEEVGKKKGTIKARRKTVVAVEESSAKT
jgi:hypothetical protein